MLADEIELFHLWGCTICAPVNCYADASSVPRCTVTCSVSRPYTSFLLRTCAYIKAADFTVHFKFYCIA